MYQQGCGTACKHCQTLMCSSSAPNISTATPSDLSKATDDYINRQIIINNGDVGFWRHIRCGWHSGLPLCCIIFFVFFWLPLFGLRYFILENEGRIVRWLKWITRRWPPKKEKYQYVACPLCVLLGRKVQIKVCSGTNRHGCCLN